VATLPSFCPRAGFVTVASCRLRGDRRSFVRFFSLEGKKGPYSGFFPLGGPSLPSSLTRRTQGFEVKGSFGVPLSTSFVDGMVR